MTTSLTAHVSLPTLGIFGGGQLGRMLAQAALPLGIRCAFLENAESSPAAVLGPVFGSGQLAEFQQAVTVLTLEFENTPLTEVDQALTTQVMHPPRIALATAQNRLLEKGLFDRLSIPTPAYRAIQTHRDLEIAVQELGLPLVVKTATGGYDGKGQWVIREASAIPELWQHMQPAVPLIAEAFIAFEREVSIIAVRNQSGEIRCWPLAENHHHQGILSHSIVPAPRSEQLEQQAQAHMSVLMNELQYVGVMTLELFVTANGLLANEMAPRVHNSGHWSIEGAVCSQFENHIRAVADLPLGSTALVQPCVMVNVIGQHPDLAAVLAIPGAHVHFYGKTEREGRKLGHITLMPVPEMTQSQQISALKAILPNKLSLPD